MARTAKRLCKGTLTNANATLYTVPASTKTTIIAITLCNKSSSDVTATIKFAGINIVGTHTISAYDTLIIPFKDAPQLMDASELIEGLAGTTSVVDYYISGVEEL